MTEDGERRMHCVSCSNLARIYTSIAAHYADQNDPESSLQYLIRAYEKSKEGEQFAVIHQNYCHNCRGIQHGLNTKHYIARTTTVICYISKNGYE